MTLPEGVQPSGPTDESTPVTEEPVVTEPDTTEPAVTVDEEPAPVDDPTTAVDESASDAELRAWARDNGIEDVPASGRLSAAWREQILNAMTAALAADPKDEASAEAFSPESSTSVETMTEETTSTSGEETSSPSTEPVKPEFDNPYGEYRSVFKAPDTFVSSQAYTA